MPSVGVNEFRFRGEQPIALLEIQGVGAVRGALIAPDHQVLPAVPIDILDAEIEFKQIGITRVRAGGRKPDSVGQADHLRALPLVAMLPNLEAVGGRQKKQRPAGGGFGGHRKVYDSRAVRSVGKDGRLPDNLLNDRRSGAVRHTEFGDAIARHQ